MIYKHMNKTRLALHKLLWLICHKTKPSCYILPVIKRATEYSRNIKMSK